MKTKISTLIIIFFYTNIFATSDPFPPSVPMPVMEDFLPEPGNTYYCATDGNNDTGDGSFSNPWYDLRGAESGGAGSPVTANSVIYFRGGEYDKTGEPNFSYCNNRLTRNGTSENPIIIANYPDEIVMWNDTSWWQMTLDGDHIYLIASKVGEDYGIKMSGMTICGDHCKVIGVEFETGAANGGDTNPAMLSVPLRDGVDGLLVSHCYFHGALHPEGIKRMVCIRTFTSSNLVVEYNLFEDNTELYQGGGVYFKDWTTNATVRYNKFINSPGGVQYIIQSMDEGHNGIYVYENLFVNVDNPFFFTNELGENINIYNNVALEIPSGKGFFYYLNSDNGTFSYHGEYYNNVIDGWAFEKGWATNADNVENLPDLFDYNLFYSESDRNEPSGWTIPSSYHTHSVTGNNAVTYDPVTQTCTVSDDYAGRYNGRYEDCIGGFTWGLVTSSEQLTEGNNKAKESIIYPNPLTHLSKLHFPYRAEYYIQIQNINGQIITQDYISGTEYLLNRNNFVPGFYVVYIKTSNYFTAIKFIVN